MEKFIGRVSLQPFQNPPLFSEGKNKFDAKRNQNHPKNEITNRNHSRETLNLE